MSYSSQRDLVLRRLEQGPATIRAFMDLGVSRFGARIWELRKQGYQIEASERRVAGKRHITYYLTGKGCSPPSERTRANSGLCASERSLTCTECGKAFERQAKARPLLVGELPFCSDAHRARYRRRQNKIQSLAAQPIPKLLRRAAGAGSGMSRIAGFIGHGRLERVSTLAEMNRRKNKLKGGKGKVTASKGIAY